MKFKSYTDVNKEMVRESINDMIDHIMKGDDLTIINDKVSFVKYENTVKTIFEYIVRMVNRLRSKSFKLKMNHISNSTIITVQGGFTNSFELFFESDYDSVIYNKVIELMKSHNSESHKRLTGYTFYIDNNVMDELLSLLNSYHLLLDN